LRLWHIDKQIDKFVLYTLSESNYFLEKQQSKYNVIQPLLFAGILAAGIFLGYKMNDKSDSPLIAQISDQEGPVQIGQVEEVLKLIDSKYMDVKDQNELVSIAIRSIINKLDPHSTYISPEDIQYFTESMEGNFKGLGIETLFLHDTVGIVKVLHDSPADRAGLQQFDQIIYIDTALVAGANADYDSIRDKLHAEEASIVLHIKRYGKKDLIKIEVTPEEIQTHTASAGSMIDDETGIIRIDQFTANTYREFMESYEQLYEDQKLKNLIIDLRNNPGGFLPEATKILNQLAEDKDKVILYTIGKNGVRREYKTNGKSFFRVANIAVLVNEESASGAEIIAGTLQDWDRAVIIGRRTYGKGLVQEQFGLSNGGALRLTTARYYLPSGRNIQKDYSNLDEYDYELESRVEDGSIFDASKSNADTTLLKFTSLNLGRKLKEFSGVEPDIFIPADSIEYQSAYAKVRSLTLSYIFDRVKNMRTMSQDLIKSKMFMDNFLSYAGKRYPDMKATKISDSDREKLKIALINDFSYITSDEDTALNLRSNEDSFVIAAMDYFKNPDLARLEKKK
jgi:carboxyl-terminal processing protease